MKRFETWVLVIVCSLLAPCAAAEPDAESMRRAAPHDSRAVWHNFPGFTANITVIDGAAQYDGTIRVTSDFAIDLTIADAAQSSWLDDKLESIISHRRPSEPPHDAVSFADDGQDHVFGRLVAQADGSGSFRIKDGVIREVHRKSASSWFEIVNLELFFTPDGHNLPQITSVTYRDPKTGDIRSNRSNYFAWTPVGDFYLPERSITVETGSAGERRVSELKFSGHQLTDAATLHAR